MGSLTQRNANATAIVISSRVLAARMSTLPSARQRIQVIVGGKTGKQANAEQAGVELHVHTCADFVISKEV